MVQILHRLAPVIQTKKTDKHWKTQNSFDYQQPFKELHYK